MRKTVARRDAEKLESPWNHLQLSIFLDYIELKDSGIEFLAFAYVQFFLILCDFKGVGRKKSVID